MSDGHTPECEHPLSHTQVEFSSNQPQEGSPETLFLKKPAKPAVERQFFNREFRFPDGREVELWTFESDISGRGFPAPLVRVKEDEVFHAYLKPGKGPHTIHWHGIEPDPRNDGVGHTSFEVTGGYLFQWETQKGEPGDPNTGTAGTYFYHCHVNTVLHVQMGMFGPLIVDPQGDDVMHGGRATRRPFVDGPPYDVETETLLVPFSLDPTWHDFSHAAGLSGEDVGLNRFNPDGFYTLGVQKPMPEVGGDGPAMLTRMKIVNAQRPYPLGSAEDVGARAPTLLRVINANYLPTVLTFKNAAGKPVKLGEVIGHDGRPYRDTSSPYAASPPVRASSPVDVASLRFGAAERYDFLLWPSDPYDPDRNSSHYYITIEWHDWALRQPWDPQGELKTLQTRTVRLDLI